MQNRDELFDRLSVGGKRWFVVFITAFVLTIFMNLVVLPPIVHGGGLPFDTGKRIYTHELKSRWAVRSLRVTAAEKAVLTVFQILPWIAIGSMIALFACETLAEKPNLKAATPPER